MLLLLSPVAVNFAATLAVAPTATLLVTFARARRICQSPSIQFLLSPNVVAIAATPAVALTVTLAAILARHFTRRCCHLC